MVPPPPVIESSVTTMQQHSNPAVLLSGAILPLFPSTFLVVTIGDGERKHLIPACSHQVKEIISCNANGRSQKQRIIWSKMLRVLMYSLKKTEYRIFKPVEATVRR
jgi:hypothetical protein